MTTTLTLPPLSELAGDWEKDQPLPVDGSVYVPPNLLGFDTAGYDGGDSAAAATATALALPSLPVQIGEVELVGHFVTPYSDSTFSTTHDATYPTVPGGILENDHIELITYLGENPDPAKPTGVSGGFVEKVDLDPTNAWQPHMNLYWLTAAGGETGTVTITLPASVRCYRWMRVWRNVDPADPFDSATPTTDHGYGNPTPAAITTNSDNAVVVLSCAGNNAAASAAISSGYTLGHDTVDASPGRDSVDCYKVVPTAGVETPSNWTWAPDQWSMITHALKPAETTTVKLVVVTSASDETATAALASGVELPAVNEVQRIQQNATGGTFQLTYAGQTTATIAYDATAAAVESALEALSNIAPGDVAVTGGDLDTNAVDVEFTGALAATDVVLLIGASGDVSITETMRGRAQEQFTKRGDLNIPRVGGNFQPQVHIWDLSPVDYTAGDPVFITVADHGSLHSWAAALTVWEGVADTGFVEVVGGEGEGEDGQSATFAAITPLTAGAKVIPILAKATAGTQYAGSGPVPSTPSGYTSIATALADATTLSLFESPPMSASAETPSKVSWSGDEHWAAGAIVLKPEVAAGGTTLVAAVDVNGDEDSYIELAGAAGNMYEVLELDLTGIPSDGVFTAVRARFAHGANVTNALRVALVGINTDDTIVAASEHQLGYRPIGEASEVVETPEWTELADGSRLFEYDRLGIAIFSTQPAVGLSSHKLYWLEADVIYEDGGPVVSAVAGPVNGGDPITWDYSSASGLPQIAYEVKVIYGTGQDPDATTTPDNPMSPVTGDLIYDSGRVYDSSARSLSITDAPLARDTCTYAVRAWTRLLTGDEIASDWDTDSVNISGAAPGRPAQNTNPAWTPAIGGVVLTVATPADTSRAWILRSVDGGVTYQVATDIGPTDITPSSSAVITDYYCPFAINTLRWMVTFDDGPMTETSDDEPIGGAFDTYTMVESWYLISPDDPSLNVEIEVAATDRVVPIRTVVAEQAGESLVGTSSPLAARHILTLRTRSRAERQALEDVLYSQRRLRLVDIHGNDWWVRVVQEVRPGMQRWRAVSGELTTLRDAYEIQVELVEVSM